MNTKRILIATAIGLLCGLLFAYGAMMRGESGEADFAVTTGLLASIVYDWVLIGFVIGMFDNIKSHPVLRGAAIGAVMTLSMSIMLIVDGNIMSGLPLLAFGIVYGIIADVVATRFSK